MSDPPAGPTLPFNPLVFFERLHRVKSKHLIPSSNKTIWKWWKTCINSFQFSMWLHLCFYSTEILVEITGVDRSCTLQRSSTRIWVAKRFINFKNRLAGKLTWNLKITKISPLKTQIVFQTSIFGFDVSFRESIQRKNMNPAKQKLYRMILSALIQIQQHPTTIQVPNLGVKNSKYHPQIIRHLFFKYFLNSHPFFACHQSHRI